MLRVNQGYIVVKEVNFNEVKSNYYFEKKHNGESRFAIVIATPKNSILKPNDTIIHDKCIMYFEAPDLGEKCYYIQEKEIKSKVVNGDIVSFRESVYVDADKEANYEINIGSLKLKKDVEYDEFSIYNRTQHGRVVAVPLTATNSYLKEDNELEIDLKKNDIVYTHHFLTHNDNERIINGKRVFEIRYEECFCRERDGLITMLNEWNLIEPIDEDESKLKIGDFYLKNKLEKEANLGLVIYPCDNLELLGAGKGEKVLFKKDRDYPIIVQNKLYYRINTRDIVAVNI